MNYIAHFAAACLLSIGLVRNPNGITTAGLSFRRSGQLPCVFETSKITPLIEQSEIIRLNVRLVLSRTGSRAGQRSQPENLPPDNTPSFIVQETSVDILQYADDDINMLECRISPYFTAKTQIIWPGRDIQASSSESWFTCTIKHTAGKYAVTAFLVQDQKEKKTPNPGQLFPVIAEQSRVSALLLVRTAPARLTSALARDVLLGCAFATDRRADVTVQWVLNQKGGHKKRLFAYNASSEQAEHGAHRAEVVLGKIPEGNASLLLRRTETRDEGTYSCLVSVASLTAEQTVQLQIEEKPTVTVNVNSLSLVEGEQHSLVCNIKHYYPHNVQAQWLREPKDSWKVPDVMRNVLSSSIRQSSNGTYSSSRYLLLTASLKDNGHRYTCRVDHPSLQTPIRRSVTLEVREAASTAWLLLLLGLAAGLAGALWYHQKERRTAKPIAVLLESGPPVPARRVWHFTNEKAIKRKMCLS